jgi:hypothetical protein
MRGEQHADAVKRATFKVNTNALNCGRADVADGGAQPGDVFGR